MIRTRGFHSLFDSIQHNTAKICSPLFVHMNKHEHKAAKVEFSFDERREKEFQANISARMIAIISIHFFVFT